MNVNLPVDNLQVHTSSPKSKNAVSAFQIASKLLSFTLGKFLKKLSDDQCSSITKDSIYHIRHIYVQLFTTVVDWPEIGSLMEVFTMFNSCRYCIFTWWGRHARKKHIMSFQSQQYHQVVASNFLEPCVSKWNSLHAIYEDVDFDWNHCKTCKYTYWTMLWSLSCFNLISSQWRSSRAQFLDPYVLVHSQNELCYDK